MINELLEAATGGDLARARDAARELADPSLLPEFRAVLGRKLKAVERKLVYEFLDYLARNTRAPDVAAFLCARLGAEKNAAIQLEILRTLWLLDGLDAGALEPLLDSENARLREAAILALGACAGETPVRLLSNILTQSAGGMEAANCATALARSGDETIAAQIIEKHDALEKTRANAFALTELKAALYALAGPRQLDWLRMALAQSRDYVERWLLLATICRIASKVDGALIASEVEAYLAAPTGEIGAITLGVTIPFRNVFQAGMAYLRRTDVARFDALAARAHAAKLPKEDCDFLDALLKA